MSNCILCGTSQASQLTETIFQCGFCKTKYWRDYAITTADYDSKYEQLYEGMSQFCLDIKTKANPMRHVADRGMPYASVTNYFANEDTPLDILDVGCGYGYFDWMLHSLQFKTTGIDVSGQAIDFAKKTYGLPFHKMTIQEYAKLGKKHDIIFSIEVLEHVQDPKDFIRQCLIIAPKVMITTPNGGFTEHVNQVWFSDVPPIHLAIFYKESLEVLAQQLECSVRVDDSGPNIVAIFTHG